MYQPKVPITNAAEVKAILGADLPTQVGKVIDHIDAYCRAWIERCPFIVISSINAAGAMDTSPKGDPAGFVRVLDKHTLAHTRPARESPRRHLFQRPGKSECWDRFHRPQTARGCTRERDGLLSKRPRPTRGNDNQWKATPARNDRSCERGLLSLREIDDPIRHVGARPLGPCRWTADVCPSSEKARSYARCFGRLAGKGRAQ
jgi:hypothetical protein